jgi:hypothetical protein
MISTVAFNINAEVARIYVQNTLEGSYATAPMAAVLPAYQPPSDEELHSSFEEAISSRLSEVHVRLTRLDSISHPTTLFYRSTEPLPSSKRQLLHGLQADGRKLLLHLGLGLIFMLSGFDLMGLLVLHAH